MNLKGEDKLQAACIRWINYEYAGIEIFAIPNGGKRNAKEAAKFKATGVKSGVSDLCLAEPTKTHCGLYIELKWGDNTLTSNQENFLFRVRNRNYGTAVCWTLEQFQSTIIKYLNNEKCDFKTCRRPSAENVKKGDSFRGRKFREGIDFRRKSGSS